MSTFTSTAVNIALPVMETEFHISAVVLSWIPLAFVVTAGAALMPASQVADLKGRKHVFLWAMIAFALFTFACGLAPSAAWLIGFRLLQGATAGMLFATTTAMVTAAYPRERRGRALGLQIAGVYLGTTAGPALGGIITHNLGWRGLFWVVGAIALGNSLLALLRVRRAEEQGTRRVSFDLRGALIYSVSLPVLLIGFSLLPGVWGIVLIAAGALGLAFFVWWEGRAADPILKVALFRRNRVFAFSNMAVFINYAATFAMTFLMSLYLEYDRSLTAQTAGFVLVAGAFVQAVFSLVSGRLVDRVEDRLVAAGGMVLCVLGLLGLSFLGLSTSYWYVIAVLCVLGAGFAFFAPSITHRIMGSVEKPDITLASATISTMRLAGQNISLGLATLVLALLVGAQEEIGPGDYPAVLTTVRITFLIFAALSALGLAACLVGRRSVPADGPAEPSAAGE